MTEEIIIDGANVKECRHCMYKGFKAFPQCKLELDSFATACVQHKDCYYKQLKRLEQENKELRAYKDINEDFKKAWDELNEKHKCYRSALEEIREIVTGNYEVLEPQAKKDIETKINEVLK